MSYSNLVLRKGIHLWVEPGDQLVILSLLMIRVNSTFSEMLFREELHNVL